MQERLPAGSCNEHQMRIRASRQIKEMNDRPLKGIHLANPTEIGVCVEEGKKREGLRRLVDGFYEETKGLLGVCLRRERRHGLCGLRRGCLGVRYIVSGC